MEGANKKIINIVGKQGELLKRLKEENEFFNYVGLSQSNIYFKIKLCKYLCKCPVFTNSTFTPSYFKGNFMLIKKVCKANADVFTEKKQKVFDRLFLYIFYPCLDSFA